MTTHSFSTRSAPPLDLERVRTEAIRARAAFETGPLPEQLPHFPRGACRRSSLALAAHLRHRGLGEWELCTGVRQEDSYTLTHAWLERGGVLLDITADQFHTYGLPLRAGPVLLGTDRSWHAQFGCPNRHPAVPFEGDLPTLAVTAWLTDALYAGE
ncbi:lasso peptide biosynthesis protein [Streptomyces sp. NPDC006367]|uniref:lasso peptide biosynthesis protein n=1 Tax=unclassified Streptomyces TaxID=2593676 RepID=UPI0033B59941